MFKKVLLAVSLCLFFHIQLIAHCQMPCGIYHDDMVFDQIDQFIETSVKGIGVMQDNKFTTVQDHNAFIRWVIQKEKGCNEIAELILTYFLQQKIKPGQEDTAKRLLSAHRLLFYLVQIKQTSDLKAVNDFYEEWEQFKLMFPVEGYKNKVNQAKLKSWKEQQEKLFVSSHEDDHDHDHGDHDHDHHHDH